MNVYYAEYIYIYKYTYICVYTIDVCIHIFCTLKLGVIMFYFFCKVAPDTITLLKFTEMLKAELCPSKNSHFEDFGSEAPGYGCI